MAHEMHVFTLTYKFRSKILEKFEVQFGPIHSKRQKGAGYLCSSERDDRLFQVQKCHSGLIKLKRLLETFLRQHTTVTFHFAARYFLFSSPPFPVHQRGGRGRPSINEQIAIVIRPACAGRWLFWK